MKGREIRTKIQSRKLPNGWNHYYVVIDGQEEGLSWYGPHLSPENRDPNTIYIIAQQIDRAYGDFMGWYIDEILGIDGDALKKETK